MRASFPARPKPDDQNVHQTGSTSPLLNVFGVGPDVAAALLITAGGNPDRMRNEASFAALCGISPIPASSGKTRRHRLNRGGDRQANAAFHVITLARRRHDPRTKAYIDKRTAQGLSPATSPDASSATSPGSCSPSYATSAPLDKHRSIRSSDTP